MFCSAMKCFPNCISYRKIRMTLIASWRTVLKQWNDYISCKAIFQKIFSRETELCKMVYACSELGKFEETVFYLIKGNLFKCFTNCSNTKHHISFRTFTVLATLAICCRFYCNKSFASKTIWKHFCDKFIRINWL